MALPVCLGGSGLFHDSQQTSSLVGILQQVDKRGNPWRVAILREKIPYPDSRCGCSAAWGRRRAGHPAGGTRTERMKNAGRDERHEGGNGANSTSGGPLFPKAAGQWAAAGNRRRDRTSTPPNPHSSSPGRRPSPRTILAPRTTRIQLPGGNHSICFSWSPRLLTSDLLTRNSLPHKSTTRTDKTQNRRTGALAGPSVSTLLCTSPEQSAGATRLVHGLEQLQSSKESQKKA